MITDYLYINFLIIFQLHISLINFFVKIYIVPFFVIKFPKVRTLQNIYLLFYVANRN